MSYETLYQIKKTLSLAQRLSEKDKEFVAYVGADPQTSETIAIIDTAIKEKLVSKETAKSLGLVRSLLVRRNKALFASLCSELSKLSFWLGIEDDSISAI